MEQALCGQTSMCSTEQKPNPVLTLPAKKAIGTWTGMISSDWYDPSNWNPATIPTGTTNVTIPAGTPFIPAISTAVAYSNDLLIQSGAELIIGNCTMTAGGSVDIFGMLTMTDPAGIFIAGFINWNDGSADSITAGQIHADYWYFNEGTNAKLGTGNTVLVKNGISINDEDAEFGNLTAVPPTKGFFEMKGIHDLRIAGDYTLKTGVNLSSTVDHHIGGLFNVENGASYTLWSTNTIFINSTAFTLNGMLNLKAGHLACHNGFILAATGTLEISGGSLVMDQPCNAPDAWQSFGGSLIMSDGLIEITHNSILFESTSMNSISGGTLRCGHSLQVTSPAVFQPTGGVVQFTGTNPGALITVANGNHFNDLSVNRTTEICLGADLVVKGDVEIVAGPLTTFLGASQFIMTVGGNWTNSGGPTAFKAGTGTVIFNGNGATQSVGSETFYNVQQDYNPPGSSLQFSGELIIANDLVLHYFAIIDSIASIGHIVDLSDPVAKFTANAGANATIAGLRQGGTMVGNGGTIDVADLVEDGIFGTYFVTSGAISLAQDEGQHPDLNAALSVLGGVFRMTGGSGSSRWSFAGDAAVTLAGIGIIDFADNGIFIYDSVFAFIGNITGGTIRTNRSFVADNPGFSPSGGVCELYGSADACIYTVNGSACWDLLINKSGGSCGGFSPENVPVMQEETSGSNTVTLGESLRVTRHLTVEEGSLNTAGFAVFVSGNASMNAGGILNINAGGKLAMDNLTNIFVNNNGLMRVIGEETNPATVTCFASPSQAVLGIGYNFNVEAGGTLGGEYGVFEHMNLAGVNIKAGAFVDILYPFNHCTFRYGYSGGRLLSISNNQVLEINGAIFPTNTWLGGFNVLKNVNAGTVNFIDATGGFSGESYDYDPYNRINWNTSGFLVDMKAYIQGPYNTLTGFMNTSINGLLPLSQPFNPALPYFGNPNPDWYYTGLEAVAAIPNANVVDWILLELRDASSAAAATPATMVARKACFLLHNGKVVDLDGVSPVSFNVPITQGLFVVLWQRNHLGIMSSVALTKMGSTYSYDFSTAAGQAYLSGQKMLAAGAYGMYSGDGNGDGQVTNTDKLDVWTTQSGTAGYKEGDFNMNGQVDNSDKVEFWKPNSGTASQIP